MPLLSLRELAEILDKLLADWPDGQIAVSRLGNIVVVDPALHEAVCWVMLNGASTGNRIKPIQHDSPFAALPPKTTLP